ncbi:MAG: efflux RND transporter periplasmic adaptor subunit [Gemmatimonadales bacterium]|nr:efflux RND transporter periplasmic adaptor subunit [Gemmatimonadales bacterium]
MTAARIALPLSLVALAGLAYGCTGRSETAVAETPTVALSPDNIAVVSSRLLSTGPSLSGSLTAARQATLRAEVAGIVTQISVEQGQAVNAGQMLVRLDDSAIRDAVLSAQSALRTATEAAAVAKRNSERSARLAEAGALAERDLEQARWTVMNAEAGQADASARLANAQKQLEKTAIRAPFSGIVSERQVNAGDVMQIGNAAVSLVDPGSLRLEATVPVSALRVLKLGTPVDFQVTGYEGKSFAGRVERINPAVDPATRQVRVFVTIPNVGGRLVVGLFAEGRVATEQKNGLAVPLSALDLKTPTPSIRRIRGGKVELIAVELGLQDDIAQLIEITAGLAVGDTVLVGPSAGIAAGTPVRLIKE